MESIEYAGLDAQRRAHESFLMRLEDKDEAEEAENRMTFLEDLLDFLYAWLGRHIMKMDKLIPKPGEKKK
jgi:hemerythrin